MSRVDCTKLLAVIEFGFRRIGYEEYCRGRRPRWIISSEICRILYMPRKPKSIIALLFVHYISPFLKCIWRIFFICSIKSPPCPNKYSKKVFFHSDFPFPCFDVPKASNFTSGGVQNRDTKNRRLGTIVTSIQDSKPPTHYCTIS